MKKITFILLAFLIITGCEKDQEKCSDLSEVIIETRARKDNERFVIICHRTNSFSFPWITKAIPESALNAHIAHGDVLPDADGDGYTAPYGSKNNPCSYGSGDDCDDLNPAVYPGSKDDCDGIDNDCDGFVDEDLDFTKCYGFDLIDAVIFGLHSNDYFEVISTQCSSRKISIEMEWSCIPDLFEGGIIEIDLVTGFWMFEVTSPAPGCPLVENQDGILECEECDLSIAVVAWMRLKHSLECAE